MPDFKQAEIQNCEGSQRTVFCYYHESICEKINVRLDNDID